MMMSRRRLALLATALLVVPSAAWTQQEQKPPQKNTLVLKADSIEHTLGVDVPPGWSLEPGRFRNSRTLVDVGPGESRRPSASVQIFVEPRLDHADALKQIRELASLVSETHKTFLLIGGWPAMRVQRVETPPPPSHAQPPDHPQVLRVQTYIAAGDVLVVVNGTLPHDARPPLIEGATAIAASLRFQSEGDPVAVQEELRRLREPVRPEGRQTAPSDATGKGSLPEGRVELVPEPGSNERINANGNGELEVATSMDGRHVVVALQSRRFVSSHDYGASFPDSGTVGTGNGDPSVAFGQSGRFYLAWIDGSSSSSANVCGNVYLNPVVAPDLFPPAGPDPTPHGMDCTGIGRSADNGASFQTNTVNPAVVCIGRDPGATDNPGECFPDQEHIAADRVNPGMTAGDDQVYSTWRNFRPGGQNASLVCSQDSGVTWTAPFEIGANEFFPRITAGQDGFVYVATYNNLGMFRLYKYNSCANGLGIVAGFPVNVAARTEYDCPFAGHDRCDQNPTSQTVAVDDTDPTHVYYAYVEDAAAAGSDSTILVRDSIDGGLMWPAGRVVEANAGVDARRIMPWLCTTGGDGVVTWYEQRQPVPSDLTDFFGGRVGLDNLGNLVARETFRISEVADSWCAIGWPCMTRWGNTDTQTSNASEACPAQPQLAGQCGDGDSPNVTADSGNLCDFSDDDGVAFTNCPQAASSPSGNDEMCLTGGGCPKYGDYSGVACAAGRLFAAWASAASPPGVPPPSGGSNPGVLFDVLNLGVLGPVITVPGAVVFEDTCAGETSFATLQVCNTGNGENLEVDVITSDDAQFAVVLPSSGFPVTISPDFCFPFQVSFTPAGPGPASATLTIPSNDPARPEIEVMASGDGDEPDIATLIADNGSYGDVCRGSFEDLALTITNRGGCDLTVTDITSNSPMLFQTASVMVFPLVVGPGDSVQVPIRFAPGAATPFGAKAAQITVVSDDPGTPNKVVAVSGNVPPGDVRFTGSTEFGDVCPGVVAEKTVSVCNVGACNLTVTSVAFEPPCDDFVLVNNPFPAVVSPDSCEEVVIRFTPQSVGPKMCNLVVRTDDPDTPVISKDVTGNVPAPMIDVPPDQFFPPTVIQSVGACQSQEAFPVSNTGTCNLSITGYEITVNAQEYSIDALPSFPIILEPGHIAGEGDLSLVFEPAVLDPDRHRLGSVRVRYLSDPITGVTTDVTRALCGEAVRTGARVLVTAGGIPLAAVERIHLQRINANRNKNILDTTEVARNVALQSVPAAPPCPGFQYHREYGTVSNPIQLLPGSYQVTATAIVNGKRVRKSVGFDVNTCTFNPTIMINF